MASKKVTASAMIFGVTLPDLRTDSGSMTVRTAADGIVEPLGFILSQEAVVSISTRAIRTRYLGDNSMLLPRDTMKRLHPVLNRS